MPALVRTGAGKNDRYDLSRPPVTIGRDPVNTIVIEEPWVSRTHVRIERSANGALEIVDCSSFKETFVNRERVARAVLKDGDLVVLGAPGTPGRSIELKFEERDARVAPLDQQFRTLTVALAARGVDHKPIEELQAALARTMNDVRVLYEVAAAINSELEVARVLDLILIHVLRATGGDKGYVLLTDAATGRLTPMAARDRNGPLERGREAQVSQSYCQKALESRGPVVAMDTGTDPNARSQSIVAYNIRSVIAAPLLARGQPLGVLYVDAQAELRQFTPKDVDFFAALANQSALAIQNARAYERVVEEKRVIESQVRELKVQMDEAEKARQVEAITDSDYFVALRNMADQIRKKF